MKKLFVFFILSGILFYSCKDNTPVEKTKNYKPFLTIVPPSDNQYGTFFLSSGSGIRNYDFIKMRNVTLKDTVYVNPTPYAAAYFGRNEPVSLAKINSSMMDQSLIDSRYHYVHLSPTLYFNGTANIIEWQKDGSNYVDTIQGNIGQISINSPGFRQHISKSGDLVITWTPSDFTDDYVHISLKGNTILDDNTDSDFTAGYYHTYAEDNGRFTIPSSVLSGFSESNATLILSRGMYKEATHGRQSYLFVLYYSRETTIYLD